MSAGSNGGIALTLHFGGVGGTPANITAFNAKTSHAVTQLDVLSLVGLGTGGSLE